MGGLLGEISAGRQLKKVVPVDAPKPQDSRGSLLDALKGNNKAKLRKVSSSELEAEKSSDPAGKMTGLAAALHSALSSRRTDIDSTDDEGDDDGDDDDWDDDGGDDDDSD